MKGRATPSGAAAPQPRPSMSEIYVPRRISRSESLQLRNALCHVRHWGPADGPVLFMFHGARDFSISFQFVVDALARDWHVIAPDRRGIGDSARSGDLYSFADYLADMDAILDHYSPGQAARVIAHSNGANVFGLFAGLRPERVAAFVDLEGLGAPAYPPGSTANQLVRFLDVVKAGAAMKRYANHAALAASLLRNNPRLGAARAAFLAQHFAKAEADGAVRMNLDPMHEFRVPMPGHQDMFEQVWPGRTAPLLFIEARQSVIHASYIKAGDRDTRIAALRPTRIAVLDDCGHNMHPDQPEQVARLAEAFLDEFAPV